MKKTRNDRTIAEKLELLEIQYNTLMYFHPLGGCLSCSFRKTGYYSQPLIASKSAGPEVDVLSGFHCTAPIESIVIHALPISSSVSWAVTPGRVHLSRPIAFPIALPHTIPLIRGNIPI